MPQDPNMPRPDMTLDEFEDAVGKHLGVPKALRRALVEQESGGNVNATSYKGARGRYQVMPDTAAKYGMDTNNPFDNVYAGLRYLKEKYDEVSPDITDEGSRWKAALAGYHGGERQIRAINKTGEIASGSDGLKTTSDYADTIMKRWAKFAQEEVGTPPVDEYGRATVDETGRPIKWQSVNQPAAAPAKPPAPKIQSRGPVRKPAPLPSFGGDPTQQMLQDVAARPVTKQKQGKVLPTKPNRFQQRSTLGQIGEILTSGAMRGVEGLYKAASIAHPQAWGKGLMTPEAQQALQQQEAEQDVEYPTAAPVARGLTTAGVQAPVYMAGGAAGLPAAMLTAGYMNAAQEDWSKDPVRSAVRTGINATLPFAASRGANALIRPITRPGVVATESIAGAAGNVVPEAIEQMAFEGQLDPQRLAQTGLMGGLSPLNVTGAGRQAEANQQARLAKVQKATGSPVTAEAAPEVAPEEVSRRAQARRIANLALRAELERMFSDEPEAAPAAPEEAATPRYTPTPEVEQGVTVADRARTRVQSARDSGDVVGEINALEGERQAVKAAMASVGRRDAIGRRALGERLASIDQEISQAKAKARGRTPQQPQTPPETPFRDTPSAEQQRIPRTPTPDENAPTADLTQDLVPTERELDVPDTGTMPPPETPITEDLTPAAPPEQPQRGVNTIYGRRSGTPIPGRQMPQTAATEAGRQPKSPIPFPMQRPRRVPGEGVEVRRSGFREAVEDARLRRDPEAMRQQQMERRRAEREASLKGIHGKFAEYAHKRRLPVHKADETVPGEINQEGNQYSLAEHPELRSLLDLPEMPPYHTEKGRYNPAWKDAAQDTLNAMAELGDKPRSSQMGLDDLRGVYKRLGLAAKRRGTVISDDLKKTFTDTAQSLLNWQTNFAEFVVDDRIDSLLRRISNAEGQLTRTEAAQISREVQRIAGEHGLARTFAQNWVKQAQAEAQGRSVARRSEQTGAGAADSQSRAESGARENVQRRATGTTGRIADEVPIPAPRSRPRAVSAPEAGQRTDTIAPAKEIAAPRATEPRPAAEPATRADEQPARAAAHEPVTPETPQAEAPAPPPAPKPRRAAKPAAKTTTPKVNEKTLTDAGWQKKSPAEFTHPDGREIYRNEKGTWVVARDGETASSHESLREAIASVAGESSPPRGENVPAPKSTPLADDVLRRPQPPTPEDAQPIPPPREPLNMPLPEPELPSKRAEMQQKEPWQRTREEYFNDAEQIRRDVGETGEGYRVRYKYTDPGGAGPFEGSMLSPRKMKAGEEVQGPFGRAVVTSSSPSKAKPRSAGEYYDEAKAFHRRTIEDALAEGKPVPPEVLADYPDLAAKQAPEPPAAKPEAQRKAAKPAAPQPEAATSDLRAKASDLKARSPFKKQPKFVTEAEARLKDASSGKWQKLTSAAKEFYADEEGSAPASPGPPRRNRVTEAVRQPQQAAQRPLTPKQEQQQVRHEAQKEAAAGNRDKDMSVGKMFRSPLSNLNYTGTYERLAGQTGKEISEAIRNYQVFGKDKEGSIADLRRELKPKIEEVRDKGLSMLADQMDAHIDSLQEPAGVWKQAANKLKGFQYNAKLRLNPRSTIINLAQPMQTLWPHLSSGDMLSIYREAVLGGGWKRVHDLALSESGGKVEGIDTSVKQGGFADKYLNWFGKSSDLNRVVGHLAGERIADRLGLTGDAKKRMAADWAKKVEFDNSKYDVPPAFRGDAASVLMQFKPFMVKNLERIASDWNKGIEGVSDGNLARRSKMVIGQIALGGMKSVIPGVAHLKAIGGVFVLGTLAKQLGKYMDQEYADKVAETMFFGLPGLFGGQDWSGSVGIIDEPFGTTTWEKIGSFLLGPTVSTAVKLIDGVAGVVGAEDDAKRGAALTRTVKGITPFGKTAETVASAIKNQGKPSIKTGKTETPMTTRETIATGFTLGMGTPIRQSNYYDQQEIDKDLPKTEKAVQSVMGVQYPGLKRLIGEQPVTDYAQSHKLSGEVAKQSTTSGTRRTATRRAATRRASRRRAIGQ